jgi:1,4-dihydroxy-2-naphthoyl-CoA hydrolase
MGLPTRRSQSRSGRECSYRRCFPELSTGNGRVGQEINANHIRSLREGVLTATAMPLHVGRTSQIWEIKIRDEREKLICVSLCTLAVVQIGTDRTSEQSRQT